MAYINSIEIPPQESIEALAAAMAEALAGALGWTKSGGDVTKPGTGMRFAFVAENYAVSLYVANANCRTSTSSSNTTGGFSTSSTYYVDYISTESSVAAGIRPAGAAIIMTNVIAENTAGENKTIEIHTATGNYSILAYLAENYSSAKTIYLPINTREECATSIVKMPDIFGGCMFRDLYIELSCPYQSSDKVYYIGGKYFRHIGLGKGGFALPVG